ncbi:unnamed protein product [Ixodes persulcatus]
MGPTRRERGDLQQQDTTSLRSNWLASAALACHAEDCASFLGGDASHGKCILCSFLLGIYVTCRAMSCMCHPRDSSASGKAVLMVITTALCFHSITTDKEPNTSERFSAVL